MMYLLAILIAVFLTPFVLCGIDRVLGTQISCNTFGWHNGKEQSKKVDPTGFLTHAKCSKCGQEVMQDSQGNWF